MNLPYDIVDEILLLLPPKSLGRFKVVCKDWYSHIQSKRFIAKHNKNQKANPNILIYHHNQLCENHAVSICSEEENQIQDRDDFPTLFNQSKQHIGFVKDMPLEHPIRFKIIGTCNGIVCFVYCGRTATHRLSEKIVTLWNPTTRKLNTLPPFQAYCFRATRMYSDHVGFGFDSTTDDYKVIRILNFERAQYSCWQDKYIIEMTMYSLSTDFWREFDCSSLSYIEITLGQNHYMLFGNKFCWLARNIGDNKMFILSFDMGKEVFQETPLPSEVVQPAVEKIYTTELFHMHDSVALVRYYRSDNESIFEIWTIKDLDQGCSRWIKLSSIGPISEIHRPLGFWNCNYSNDLLFIFSSKRIMNENGMSAIFMNIEGQIKKTLVPIKIKNSIVSSPMQVFTYVETLLSVTR